MNFPQTPHLSYQNQELTIEQVSAKNLIKQYGSPLYVYSQAELQDALNRYTTVLKPEQVRYAVKANSNLSILKFFAQQGTGFDTVSWGEISRALIAGAKPKNIVFSGVAKTVFELEQALKSGIGCINVESKAELERLLTVSQNLNIIAPISIRVNPDVDPKTHPYISTGLKENKFGVSMLAALDLYIWAKQFPQNFDIIGLDCHIGSQITEISPFQETIERLLGFMTELLNHGIHLHHLDIGGGLGICYKDETPQSPEQLLTHCQEKLNIWAKKNNLLNEQIPCLICEPGRSLVGNSGVLLTTVQYLKENEGFHFALVDAAMNDLMRPSLYGAFHEIVNTSLSVESDNNTNLNKVNIVGPICETGDFLGKNRELSAKSDDVLAILSAGAYGFTMSSQYNTRPRVAEVLVNGNEHRLIRHREKLENLFALELDLL